MAFIKLPYWAPLSGADGIIQGLLRCALVQGYGSTIRAT